MSDAILSIIGTAQDGGVPHPNCFCETCANAMHDPSLRRHAASLAIVLPHERKWHLIDATPDLKEQMAKLQVKYNLQGIVMESIFLTHAHMGHFPGMLFLGKEAMNTRQVPVFTGMKMAGLLREQAPWSQLSQLNNIELSVISDKQPIQVADSVTITPVEVPHRNELSETFGFWITGPNKKVLYIPDIDRWDEWAIDIHSACREADICIIDGTFHSSKDLGHIGRDFREIPHPLMTDTMDRLGDLTGQKGIYFTHMNHSNPAINKNEKVRSIMQSKGFNLVDEGMEIEL